MIWAVAGAAASMALYRLLSPQETLSRLAAEVARARRDLAAYDGGFREVWPRIGRTLGLSARQLRFALVPAAAACLPVLVLMAWLGTAYGHHLPPPGAVVAVEAFSADGVRRASWRVPWPGEGEGTTLRDAATGREILTLPLAAPVPVVHKARWWNAVLGNPAGYLDDAAAVDLVTIGLPERTYVALGPGWARGWEAAFLLTLTLCSLAIKVALRVK